MNDMNATRTNYTPFCRSRLYNLSALVLPNVPNLPRDTICSEPFTNPDTTKREIYCEA